SLPDFESPAFEPPPAEAPTAQPSLLPAPAPMLALPAPRASTVEAPADGPAASVADETGPRSYPLLPPPRRPNAGAGSGEPLPGGGRMELPPDVLSRGHTDLARRTGNGDTQLAGLVGGASLGSPFSRPVAAA